MDEPLPLGEFLGKNYKWSERAKIKKTYNPPADIIKSNNIHLPICKLVGICIVEVFEKKNPKNIL